MKLQRNDVLQRGFDLLDVLCKTDIFKFLIEGSRRSISPDDFSNISSPIHLPAVIAIEVSSQHENETVWLADLFCGIAISTRCQDAFDS